jgi:hypothetical protein
MEFVSAGCPPLEKSSLTSTFGIWQKPFDFSKGFCWLLEENNKSLSAFQTDKPYSKIAPGCVVIAEKHVFGDFPLVCPVIEHELEERIFGT